MRLSLRLFAFLLPVLIFTACERKTFSPEGGGFTVEMPCKPQQQSTAVETPAGPVNLMVYLCRTANRAYMVGYSDYSFPDMKEKAESLLDGAREGALKKGNNRLVSELSISLDGHPGRELRMEAPNGPRMRVRMILVGNRLYQIGVVTPKVEMDAPEIGKFLDSFRLTRTGKGS
jgi:hypothetical protein